MCLASDETRWWEMEIIDGLAPAANLASLAVGDIDSDGKLELVTGGKDALLWYRPATFERGCIDRERGKFFSVGAILADVDGDGTLEVVTGKQNQTDGHTYSILCYKHSAFLDRDWKSQILDPDFPGQPHDILFVDIDKDGVNELIAIACYTPNPGIAILKKPDGRNRKWRRHMISDGIFAEGLQAGDLNGDGNLEIVCGPYWYSQPPEGPLSGPWHRHVYAPGLREMCRTALVDITGNGQPDILALESEYVDGRLAWFENKLIDGPNGRWIEHGVSDDLVYAHSLDLRIDKTGIKRHLFVAEMAQGGWDAPYNHDARLLEYSVSDGGKTWERRVIYRGAGTHQALYCDLDNDGEPEIVGKTWGHYWQNPKVQMWKKLGSHALPALEERFTHTFVDRDKPEPSISAFSADVDGDGLADILAGRWWYRNGDWRRFAIPGVAQVLTAYDVDGDGRQEIIAVKEYTDGESGGRPGVIGLCWLKPLKPTNGLWEEHAICETRGRWPRTAIIAPLLADGQPGLIVGYGAPGEARQDSPDLFAVPRDPRRVAWPLRWFSEASLAGDLKVWDLDGNGSLDVVSGGCWLENLGNGSFSAHEFAPGFGMARVAVGDINGDGRPDVVLGEERLDSSKKVTPYARVAWFENSSDPRRTPWEMHVVDTVRCPSSIDVADIDDDGEQEIIVGEHDPVWPYRSRCRLIVYKKRDRQGRRWVAHIIDGKFEHYNGAKVVELSPGKKAILSHGRSDYLYVHLWEIQPERFRISAV